jgi:hypothetical protein
MLKVAGYTMRRRWDQERPTLGEKEPGAGAGL